MMLIINKIKIYALAIIFITILLITAISCSSSAPSGSGNNVSSVNYTSLPLNRYFTGEGGKGKSIAIIAPKAIGLTDNQEYFPVLVQGELVNNFTTYSAISVMDRVRLDEQYAELSSGYYSDNALEIFDLGHLPPTDYLMGGSITKTNIGYALQLNITRNTDKMTIASYSSTCTFTELNNLLGVRRASLDLLQKLDVTLTEYAKKELGNIAQANHVNAQTSLAQGITSQKQGTIVAALSHYIASTNYDPSLTEAASRLNILANNISSGNIGEDTRNDIAWRRQWVSRLQEAENFIINYIKGFQPYYLIYSTNIQKGNIDYQNETINLSIQLYFYPDTSWSNQINSVLYTIKTGLEATGRTQIWGLDWPKKTINSISPFINKTEYITVVVEIFNEYGNSIGSQTARMLFGFDARNGIFTQSLWVGDVSFSAVNANLITDTLTIKISSIDRIVSEIA